MSSLNHVNNLATVVFEVLDGRKGKQEQIDLLCVRVSLVGSRAS